MPGALSEAVLQDLSSLSAYDGNRGETFRADGDVSDQQLATPRLGEHKKTFTFSCLLLSTFTFTGEHKKREGRKPGSRLWQSDLHNKKARAQRQPSEHSCRDFATSERSDLQQKDESNIAEGKHWPDQPRGEVRDLLPICPWISKGGMSISVTISSCKYRKGVSSIFVLNIQRRLKNRKQRLVPTERTPFWLLPAFFTSWHFYFLPYLTFLLATGLSDLSASSTLSFYSCGSELVCSTSWRQYFLGERPGPELLAIALTRFQINTNIFI